MRTDNSKEMYFVCSDHFFNIDCTFTGAAHYSQNSG